MQEATSGVPNERTNLGNSARLLPSGEILLLLNAHVHEYPTGQDTGNVLYVASTVLYTYVELAAHGYLKPPHLEASAFRSPPHELLAAGLHSVKFPRCASRYSRVVLGGVSMHPC